MKNALKSIVFILVTVFSSSYAFSTEQESLKTYEGIYLGFSPTDESAVVMGEMEVTIKGKEIKIRMATGHRIQEAKMRVAEFVPMTTQEVKEIFRDGSEYPARTVGFKAQNGFPKLLFLKDPKEDEFGLIISTGGMGEILGPTLLYGPVQVARGDHEKAIQNIEKQAGRDVLPRLRNGGRAEKK